MFSLTPKEDKFFDFFVETANIAYKASNMLVEFLKDLDNSEENLKKLKEVEHEGDRKQHQILEELNKTFITPFDREDIYVIAKDMDDIIDYIESTASRFVMLNVTHATKEAIILSDMIVACCKEIITVMEELKNMKTSKYLSRKIIEINRIEEDGDKVSRRAIMDLFRSDVEVIEVIKWREIYQYLEDTLDACEDIANVIEGVVMKNA
jgi:predicted phosphate transport protein (TIGR00153 family)